MSRCSNSSDQRQGFRWTIQTTATATNERNQLRRRQWHPRGRIARQKNERLQRPRQQLDCAALIVEGDHPVVVAGVQLSGIVRNCEMDVAGHRLRFIDVECVIRGTTPATWATMYSPSSHDRSMRMRTNGIVYPAERVRSLPEYFLRLPTPRRYCDLSVLGQSGRL